MGGLQSQNKSQADLWEQDDQRLFFNFLRISPTYWQVCSNSKILRLHKHMHEEQRAAIQCHRRYGSVFDTSYDNWSNMNRIKFKNDSKPAIQLLDGTQVGVIKSDDQFIHLPMESQAKLHDLKLLLDSVSVKQMISTAVKAVKVRVASLWKIINLVYTRALNPDIEQWRVGALVKLVKAFEHLLDPWAPRSVQGHEDMRRHMNLMVKRLLDRAAMIAENAARDLFPNEQGVLHPQFKLNFGHSDFATRLFAQGDCEAIYARNRALCA